MRTAELEEAWAFLDSHYYRSVLRPEDSAQPLDGQFDVVQLGPVSLGRCRFGANLNIAISSVDAYHVNISHSGPVRDGQRPAGFLPVTSGVAALYQPGDRIDDHWRRDNFAFSVTIEPAALRAQLARMLDTPITRSIQLVPRLDVTTGAGLSWARLVRILTEDCFDHRGLISHPLLADRLIESIMGGFLLSTDHRYRDDLDRHEQRVIGSKPVRLVIDAIQARPESPFTLAGLSGIAGVSQRTLQVAFRRHVGKSPMQYLRDVRLARAHEELCNGVAATVASVSYTWGFPNLGRFAALYRARYGISPSEQLRSGTSSRY